MFIHGGNWMDTSQMKEDIHISYISALCASVGVSYDTQRHDADSTDGIIKKRIHFEDGRFYDSSLRIQLKSTSSKSQFQDHSNYISYKLKAKNYNDLCAPATTPIILGLLILPEKENDWIQWSPEELSIRGCMYWKNFAQYPKSNNKSSVTVNIEKENVLNGRTLIDILKKIAKEDWLF